MFRWAILIFCLLAAGVGLSIGVLNPDPVEVILPGWSFELPLGSVLMATFAVGLLAGLLLYMIVFHLPNRLRRKQAASAARRAASKPNA
jgi:uncharacterized integral membrane protein